MNRNCKTCGGALVPNGGVTHVQGKRRRFYRCTGDCGLGGWVNIGPKGTHESSRGPVFEGLRGRMSPHLARSEAAKAARERAAVIAGE